MHPIVERVTREIADRSRDLRTDYESRMALAAEQGPRRHRLACSNLAHGMAACRSLDKQLMENDTQANIAIVSSYNDMLSAHEPFRAFPNIIKEAVRDAGAIAQFAGGVPAMCDGVTQGEAGMELSLFSRDVIAMSTAVALSHDMFDATLCLGVCDKIVPGLLMGALSFGHLPTIFVPAGPMISGLPNDEKRRVRMDFAEGKIGRKELLAAESAAYHGPGTCTFYGTANSNQMLMEIMGLHLPGASFVNPYTGMRDALTKAAARRALELTELQGDYTPLYQIVTAETVVNGIVGLLATGGSTNHTIHIIAIARAAGLIVTWDDMSALSSVVPSLTRIYPNGSADVNGFQAAGGMSFLMSTLLDADLLHEDVDTVVGHGLSRYTEEPQLDEDGLIEWKEGPGRSLDPTILRPATEPFAPTGGLKLLKGNVGRAVIKTSAVAPEHRMVEAPAILFDDQKELQKAFERGELERDFVAVVRFQGPRANGMPELHKLTPTLSILQKRGFAVALVTDGRMSGASGKVPAAIHITPECAAGGPLARVRNGDMIRVDGNTGVVEALVEQAEWDTRDVAIQPTRNDQNGCGRELFAGFRRMATGAEQGATVALA